MVVVGIFHLWWLWVALICGGCGFVVAGGCGFVVAGGFVWWTGSDCGFVVVGG